jgi:hypothetical protein
VSPQNESGGGPVGRAVEVRAGLVVGLAVGVGAVAPVGVGTGPVESSAVIGLPCGSGALAAGVCPTPRVA